jgi:hypothetical protein
MAIHIHVHGLTMPLNTQSTLLLRMVFYTYGLLRLTTALDG